MESTSTSYSSIPVVLSKLPIDTNTQKHFSKNVTIEIPYEKLDLVLEQPVDFESLRA
ncbi:hypothetical protein A2U01_0116439, partial [Trifolium medium]|nr:hypothetical protein [Trifolium medium]